MMGGTWSISFTGVGSISGATLCGLSAGTATITYAATTGCITTQTITVDPLPLPITGTPLVCTGTTTTLADATTGGTWVSANPSVATVGMFTGIVSGTSYGTTNISYVLPTGCGTGVVATVTATSATFTVTGGGGFCAGGGGVPVNLSGSTLGAVYQLYNGASPVGAPVAGTGSSLSFGTFTAAGIYTVVANPGTSCSSAMSGSATIMVNPLPAAYTLTGGGTYCSGGTGVHIILSGSQMGVSYQLYMGIAAYGAPMMGTGASIDFGAITTPGVYTAVGVDVTTGCYASMSGSVTVTVGSLPTIYSITGGGAYCAGGTGVHIGLVMSDPAINYSLYNGGALVSTLAGTGAAIDFGLIVPAGSYTIVATNPATGCTSATTAVMVAVNPLPAAYAVTGGGSYCTGGSGVDVGLAGSSVGVNYQLLLGGMPVGLPIAGTGAALDFGFQTAAGVYTIIATDVTTTCVNTMPGSATVSISSVVVPAVSIGAIPGTTVCTGTTVAVTATPVNGGSSPSYQWAVNGVAIPGATNASWGPYTPVGGDVVSIMMTSSALCASPTTASTSVTMTVDVPAVTATSTTATCGGAVTLMAGGAVSYSWSPSTGLSCPSCATTTLDPLATTTYTVTGTDGTGCTGTATVTVAGNRIYGHISYTGTSSDSFRVWLIQFNPSDSSIAALDSMYTCMDGGVPYYEFDGKAAGNYLVKARLLGTIPGTSGYVPTYGLSTPNWYLATTIAHTAAADNQPITMVYGTVPPGPGFIAGYVVSGAGRTTAGDIPAAGMTIYLKDATGHTITYVTTGSDGTYSFSNLAYGTYQIWPESYKYYTTPSVTITLAPGADSVTTIDFKQHTHYGTITPYDNSQVHQLAAAAGGSKVELYPNPAGNTLHIQCDAQAAGNSAEVSIVNVIGREVLHTTVNIDKTTGHSQLDISGLREGMYMINIKSDAGGYTSRLVISRQ
jgi:hypothetical protein